MGVWPTFSQAHATTAELVTSMDEQEQGDRSQQLHPLFSLRCGCKQLCGSSSAARISFYRDEQDRCWGFREVIC